MHILKQIDLCQKKVKIHPLKGNHFFSIFKSGRGIINSILVYDSIIQVDCLNMGMDFNLVPITYCIEAGTSL